MESQTADVGKKYVKRAVYALGKLFPVSPKNLSEGLYVCRELYMHGIHSTLGKFSKAGDDPAEIVAEYQSASNALGNDSPSCHFYLSIKPPALDFNLENSVMLAAAALQNGHGVHFDSHEYAQTDRTLQLLEQVMDRNIPAKDMNGSWKFGVTLPSRWKRSMDDATWAAEKDVRVRLVKGEFKASDSSDETDPVTGFLALVDRLAGNVPEIAVATHDYALAREAITRCRSVGSSVQLELLFGMPAGAMTRLSSEMGVPVRFYVPYGDTLLIYGIRFFLANPRKLLVPDFLQILAGQEAKLAKIVASL